MPSRAKLSRKATKKVNYADEVESESDGMSSELNDQDGSYGNKNSKKGGKKKTAENSELKVDVKKPGENSKKTKGEVEKEEVEEKRRIGCPFDQVPVELMTDILSRVNPRDLLAFAKTNKYYRSLLKSPESNRIWKRSRQRLGLPDLTADDLSEHGYASLLWGRGCDYCSEHWAEAEPWLRARFCKPCRKIVMVKIDARLTKSDRHYHPATFDCVLTTPHTPSDMKYRTPTSRYALVRDLDFFHNKLSDLQKLDDSSAPVEEHTSVSLVKPEASDSRRQPRRENLRKNKTGPISYKETDEEVETIEIREGGRVQKLVADRKKLVEKVFADAPAIEDGMKKALRLMYQEQEDAQAARELKRREEVQSLERDVRERLDSLDGYESADFEYLNIGYLSSLIKIGEDLTNEGWTKVQARVLDTINKGKVRRREDQRKQKLAEQLTSRQRSCDPYFESLKASLHRSMIFPVFADFLLLPSVKALWKPEPEDVEEDQLGTIDESAWKLVLPLIEDEVREHHLDFVTLAVRLILSAHREFETEEALEEAIQETLEGDLDSFLSLATSLVMCEKCRGQRMPVQHGFLAGFNFTQIGGGFLGSLPQVASHLAYKHDLDRVVPKRQTKPNLPICLPLQVASTISALIEVGGYSPKLAKVHDLDRLDLGRFEWENSTTGQKRFGEWRKMVDAISLAAHKTERRPAEFRVPTPAIAYYPSSGAPVKRASRAMDSDEEMEGSTDEWDSWDDSDDSDV
ncbi:hypothetical protein JCM16303_007386 [Sporobolomyces ruberrimus]